MKKRVPNQPETFIEALPEVVNAIEKELLPFLNEHSTRFDLVVHFLNLEPIVHDPSRL